jgi:hypothetical protein
MNPIERLESILSKTYSNKRHLEAAADQVYMSCFRTGVDLSNLLDNIESNNVFSVDKFSQDSSGNVFDYINKEFRECVMRFVDITAGGNGGMASIGRGEFMISFASNFRAKISKNGKGDLVYVKDLIDRVINEINEEVKWNGGKINVSDTQGKEVFRSFLSILKKNDQISFLDKDFIPFRKKNTITYTVDVINVLNARFWQAITGEIFESITDVELKKLCLHRAFNLTFSKSDSILIVNENGEFVRFKNADNAVEYYNNKIEDVKLEIRAKQTNPIAIYLFV